MKILSRDEFKKIFESQLYPKLEPSIESAIIKGLLETEFFTIEEKEFINKNIQVINETFDISLNEGFLENFKKKISNATEEIGKSVADKLTRLSDSVQHITKAMVDAIKKLWDEAIKFFHNQFSGHKDDIVKKFEGKDQKFYEKIAEELKSLKETISFWVNAFITKLTSGVQSMFPKAVEEGVDFKNIEEVKSFLSIFESSGHGDEGHGIVNKVIHAVGEKPPFSWLHALQTKYKIAIGTGLNKFSEVTSTFGGPGPYDFEVLALVAASYAELKSKDLIKGFIVKPIFKFLLGPIGATIVSVVGYVALAITVYETAQELAKMGDKKHSDDEHKDKESKEDKHSEDSKDDEETKDKDKEDEEEENTDDLFA